MSNLVPSSLKVTELREELSRRSLPTKGNKAELVARLTEALNTNTVEETDEAPEEEPIVETPTAEKPTEEAPTESVVESTVKKIVEEITEVAVETYVEEVSEAIIQDTVEIQKEEIIEKSSVEVAEKPLEKDVVKSVETPVTNETPTSERVNEATTNKRKLSVEENDSVQEKRSKVESTSSETALYVKGFVRPLISRHVQELFGKYGKVKRFWMDFIKTHTYVIYETAEEASLAFESIDGIIFPADTGKKLAAGRLTQTQAEQLMDYEQNAAFNHLRIDWEPLLEKLKAGESLSASPGGGGGNGRTARSVGMNQIAKQLAQAAEPNAPPNSRPAMATPTPPVEASKELSLDELFRKTTTLPSLYYLPVSEEQAKVKLESIRNL